MKSVGPCALGPGRLDGGEEFIAVFVESGLDEAWTVADRIRREVGVKPHDTRAGSMSVLFSTGISQGKEAEDPSA